MARGTLTRRSYAFRLLVFFCALGVPAAALCQPTVSTIHAFTRGELPQAGLTLGPDGRLYGTTARGGTLGFGTVFRLEADGSTTTLYEFTGGDDGSYPLDEPVIGPDGTVYGTTYVGDNRVAPQTTFGSVWAIDPHGQFRILHTFDGADGCNALSMTLASDGFLYGTTINCDKGEVFRIHPSGTGFVVLHRFTGGADAVQPFGRLIQASDGGLYGTTVGGPTVTDGQGNTVVDGPVVYRLDATGTPVFVHALAFGDRMWAGVIERTSGEFWGVSQEGGASGAGTIFKLFADGTFTTMHEFNVADGQAPMAPLLVAPDGWLYGTTQFGGTAGLGTLFRISADGTFEPLYSFSNDPSTPGADPIAPLVVGADGRLYGTTTGFGNDAIYAVDIAKPTTMTNVGGSGTYRGSAALSATLIAGSAAVSGRTVMFAINGSPVGSAQTDGNGVATLPGVSLAGISAGIHAGAVSATFAGDALYKASSASGDLAVGRATPTVVWSAPPPIRYGALLGFAQLNASADVPGTFTYTPPAGTLLAVGTGQTLSVLFTPVDSASYATVTASVQVDVFAAETRTTIAATPAGVGVLQPVSLTATVTVPVQGAGVLTGSVQFFDGATLLGSAPLANGAATFVANGLTPGSHGLTANYVPDANHTASTSPTAASVTVAPLAASTFTFAFPLFNPVLSGRTAILGAIVETLSGTPAQGGTVQFFDGSTLLGTVQMGGPFGQGFVAIAATLAGVGPHAIVARYSGTSTLAPSTSPLALETVYTGGTAPAPASLSITASATQIAFGHGVDVTATITPTAATGNVYFFVDGALAGSAAIGTVDNASTATLTVSALGRGAHVVSAVYPGDVARASGNAMPILVLVQ